eukprot:scaffold82897_cov68-Phaeocystis_antarctica.AAC.1
MRAALTPRRGPARREIARDDCCRSQWQLAPRERVARPVAAASSPAVALSGGRRSVCSVEQARPRQAPAAAGCAAPPRPVSRAPPPSAVHRHRPRRPPCEPLAPSPSRATKTPKARLQPAERPGTAASSPAAALLGGRRSVCSAEMAHPRRAPAAAGCAAPPRPVSRAPPPSTARQHRPLRPPCEPLAPS